MSNTRPELSKKNPYWIPKHRFYELKHFCLQYPEWKEQKLYFEDLTRREILVGERKLNDKTFESANKSLFYASRIRLIEECARMSDKEICGYLLRGVTEGLSFTQLQMMHNIPCGKDMYYDRYRKFFYILDSRQKQIHL